ncbi:MAG: amino acid adenylation domain-containing protein [Bacteroidaceae bacterium]|nr:amino acid adenylation domain-containing protein [Bacteroidaceae bacterium]
MDNLCSLLCEAAISAPNNGLIVVSNSPNDSFISYSDLLIKSKKIAHILRFYYNLERKSKIIISVEKSEDFILLFWGCIMAECVPVLMPAVQSSNKNSIAYERLRNAIKILKTVTVITNDVNIFIDLEALSQKTILFEDIIKQSDLLNDELLTINKSKSDELCVIQFSSGSTGSPKGVMLNFSSILANLKMKTIADEITSNDTLIHWMPYFHDYGLFGNHLLSVYNQITEIKIEPYFFLRDPLVFLKKISEYRVSICGGATPSGLEYLIQKLEKNCDEVKDLDFSHVKTLSLGAEMVPTNLYERLIPLFNLGFDKKAYRPGYGMAENTLIISSCLPGEGDKTIKIDRESFYEGKIKLAEDGHDYCEFLSAGKAMPGMEVRIVNDGIVQKHMKLGEIQIKGPSLMSGYYNNEQATDEVLQDGWLSTGDLGFIDKDNIIYLVGRKKETIIVNGQNYHPFDLENCLLEKYGLLIDKSVFTSFYSNKEKREIVLHFFVPSKKMSDEQLSKLIYDCNSYMADKVGFAPEYSIKIRKGDILRTSSSKVKRRAMAYCFEQGKYDSLIVKSNKKDCMKDYNDVLKGIWSDVLKNDKIGVDDNFFVLGGDSIRSMMAVSKIEEIYNIKLENSFFYKYPTIDSQKTYLEGLLSQEVQSPINEYELLVREFVSEELGIPFSEIKYTENIISKATSFENIYRMMQRLTEVFDRISLDDIKDKTCVRDIAQVIRESYKTPKDTSFPLMDFQETLFYHSKSFIRNEPTGLSCYIICRTQIKGHFDKEYWDKTLNHIIECHPLLHSVLYEESDNPEMITLSEYPVFESSYEDITSLSKEEQKAFFLKKDKEDHDYRFDLKKCPLFYCNIYKTDENEHELIIHIDHQVIDGYSFFQFLQELTRTYDQLVSGKTVTVEPERGLLFSDYVFVEKFRRQTKRYKNAMDFALKVFKDLPEKITIPMKCQPSLINKVHFNTLHTELDASMMSKVVEISAKVPGICLNSLLMACYFKLMNLWSGQNDLIINMPVFNREQHLPNAKDVLGSFLDIFPVRIQTSPQEPIVSVARNIEKFVRTMLEYPISSIELSRRIAEQEGLKQSSLSAIIFSNSINMLPKGISRSSENITIGAPNVQTGAPGTYIDLVMYTWEDKWCFDWNYVRELFDETFIMQLSDQFTSILKQLSDETKTENYEERSCSAILPKSYVQLLEQTNQTDHVYPIKTIHEQIKDVVNKYPDREAVSFHNESLTYVEFWKKANQMAHFLRSLGVERHSKVVLLLNRTIDMPIVQLGILLAGGTYVPIDPSYPSDRIQYMVDDCGAEVLVSQGVHSETINGSYTSKIKHCVLLDDDDICMPETYIRHTKSEIHSFTTEDITLCNDPEDLIYMIYTSGSTGQPKGTMLRHRNVSNFLNYEKEAFNVTCNNRFAFVTSYSFDMTVTSNWLPFISGASLHILSDSETKDIEKLLHFIDDKRINFLNVTPSHFSMLVNTLGFLEHPVNISPNMTIMLGAELINVSDINRWLESYPQHRFINEYGPTETTVASTFYPIPVEDDGKCHLSVVPIGKPIYNTQVYVLNDNLEPTLPEVPGILYIGGAGVSRGYLNKEEKTKSVFVTNPITHDGIVYNTGDVVKMTLTGDIVFVGRKDFQVNVRGYRIELGEIENALLQVPNITESCAAIQYDVNKQPTVVAFYVTADGNEIDYKDILSVLQTKIPHYMLPSAMARIDQIPISANGKTDKKQLPDIANQKQNLVKRNVVGPRNEREEQLVHIWEDVLGLPEVGINDNFWEIGGDSIRSVRLIKELKEAGMRKIKLKDLFERPTIAELLEQETDSDKVENIICMRKVSDPSANLVCLPYAAGTPGMYSTLAGDFSGNINLYTVQYPGHGDGREIKASVDEVGELLVNELRSFDKDIPLYIMGYSYSCYIAYDICKRLESENIPIQGIIMIGGTPPTLRDDLMEFFSKDDKDLLDYSHAKDLLNEELIATLSEDEKHEYLHELRMNTVAMVNYNFLNSKLKTPLCSIVGKEDEPTIRENQHLWNNYFPKVNFFELPGGHVLITKYHVELAELIMDYINTQAS